MVIFAILVVIFLNSILTITTIKHIGIAVTKARQIIITKAAFKCVLIISSQYDIITIRRQARQDKGMDIRCIPNRSIVKDKTFNISISICQAANNINTVCRSDKANNQIIPIDKIAC